MYYSLVRARLIILLATRIPAVHLLAHPYSSKHDGLYILQYADDIIIFIDHDPEQAQNLKLLLCAFEQLSGLKINFHKS